MKKNGILNAPLSEAVAAMGHTYKLVICDCGLPIPKNNKVIDLALKVNVPRFMETLNVVLEEFAVEEAIIAEEMIEKSNGLYGEVTEALKNIKVIKVPHEEFKNISKADVETVFVRTGETTPYANVILVAGVTF